MNSLIPKKLAVLSLGGIAAIGLGLQVLKSFQGKLMYHPNQYPLFETPPAIGNEPRSPSGNQHGDRSPADWGLPYERVSTTASDGVTLRGWLIKQKDHQNKPTLVFFHENAGNIGTRLFYFRYYYEIAQVNILVFAYRGYSDSDEVPTINEEGLQKDSQAILKFAVECGKINKNNIFLHGRSLGGAVLAYGANNTKEAVNNIRGVILENTFTSMSEMVDVITKGFLGPFKKFILSNHWPTIDQVPKIKIPSLFIQSENDELVPAAMMQSLYDSSGSEQKEIYRMKGNHNDNWVADKESYFQRIAEFIFKHNNPSQNQSL